MPLPLVQTPISADVEVVGDYFHSFDGAPLVVELDMSLTSTEWGLFGTAISADIEVMPGNALTTLTPGGDDHLICELDATIQHFFTGQIGGAGFIPSYPQWDRQETQYPFAF